MESIKRYVSIWIINYVEQLLILASAVTECVSVFAFASLVAIPVGIISSALGIKICTITAGIKKCKSGKKRRRSMMK